MEGNCDVIGSVAAGRAPGLRLVRQVAEARDNQGMTERLDDVWATRDYPVLREVTRRIDAGDVHVHQNVIAEAVGLEPEEVKRAAARLNGEGLVTLTKDMGPVRFVEVSGSAYLITGLHPDADDALSRLVQALQQAAEQTSDQDERSDCGAPLMLSSEYPEK